MRVYRAGRITSGDQLMPLFVLDTMGSRAPGLTGLFLAGVCSSALCSVSASLNSLAAIALEDYVLVKINEKKTFLVFYQSQKNL